MCIYDLSTTYSKNVPKIFLHKSKIILFIRSQSVICSVFLVLCLILCSFQAIRRHSNDIIIIDICSKIKSWAKQDEKLAFASLCHVNFVYYYYGEQDPHIEGQSDLQNIYNSVTSTKTFYQIEICRIVIFQYLGNIKDQFFQMSVKGPQYMRYVNLENGVVSVRSETSFRLHVIVQINDGSEKNRFQVVDKSEGDIRK